MRLRTVSVVVGLVLACGVAADAQYRNGQARPQSAAPRPGPPRAPAGEAPFRNTATADESEDILAVCFTNGGA